MKDRELYAQRWLELLNAAEEVWHYTARGTDPKLSKKERENQEVNVVYRLQMAISAVKNA